jgi:hypothetical protein
VLLFVNGGDFGSVDANFGHDIGFYVFDLPFWRFLQSWGVTSLLVIILLSLGTYAAGALRWQLRLTAPVRAHLSTLGALLLVAIATGYQFDIAELSYSTRGIGGTIQAATYTDLHAQVPAFVILTVVVAIAASRRGMSPVPAVGALVGAGLVPPLAVVAWLASVGALGAWISLVVDYLLPLYSRLGRPAQWGFHRWTVWMPIAVAVALSLVSAPRRGHFGSRHLVALLGVAYGLAHYVGQGKGWEYHLYPLMGFACPLAASSVDPVLPSPPAPGGEGAHGHGRHG